MSGAVAWLLPAVWGVAGAAAYAGATSRYRRLRRRRWPVRRSAAWAAGLLLLVAALSPPVERISGSATGHVVQHLLLGMLAPVVLVLAAPLTLLLGVVDPPARRGLAGLLGSPAVRLLAHPVVAGALHVGGLLLVYLTPLYAVALRDGAVHLLVHVHFVLAGSLFAWSIAGPDPAPGRPGTGVRLAVLVAAGAVHSFVAKLLYARAGELPPGAGHPVADAERAAQWMYYGGDLVELVLAVALFAGWYRAAGHRWRRAGVSARRTG